MTVNWSFQRAGGRDDQKKRVINIFWNKVHHANKQPLNVMNSDTISNPSPMKTN